MGILAYKKFPTHTGQVCLCVALEISLPLPSIFDFPQAKISDVLVWNFVRLYIKVFGSFPYFARIIWTLQVHEQALANSMRDQGMLFPTPQTLY